MAACASPPPNATTPTRTAASPNYPTTPAAPVSPTERPYLSEPGVRNASGAAMCKADEFQWLIGKPRTEIPVPVDVVNRRVACTTCPITEDYSPYRLNIFYNQRTGLIEQVRCG
ncbi:hypothetical protein [Brevundimonas naejangsanensis]|uniref:hypothetical protein n=1 Tax=Brevundimonas naejangsanensis TaxID=588932 RepID=UPI0026EB3E0B|nr:hypothetical protein [Brevundimonas naejangsanensis]